MEFVINSFKVVMHTFASYKSDDNRVIQRGQRYPGLGPPKTKAWQISMMILNVLWMQRR